MFPPWPHPAALALPYVAGEYHAAALCQQVHVRGTGFIHVVNVMRMRQSHTLPARKFVLHRLLVLGASPYPTIHF
jgi:hypothetical protein